MSKIKTQGKNSTKLNKNTTIILSIIGALTILIAAYIANGSEYEDAWLYITALWIVIIPAFEFFSKKK